MGSFDPNTIGQVDDQVTLTLAGEDVLIAESYEAKASIFTQPAAWSIRLGHGGVVASLLAKYPPRTPFELRIAGNVQQSGWLDAPGAEESSGATEFTVRGRDTLAALHDAYVDSEVSFADAKYIDLVRKQLDLVGLEDRIIVGSNLANRSIKSGVRVVELEPLKTVDQILTEAGGPPSVSHQTIQYKLGERRYEFLKRYLDLAGLFLFATGDGNFVLSAPNAKQRPVARIVRKLGQLRTAVNVKSASFVNGTENRFSRYDVYGRGAGRKGGHPKALGTFTDDEMVGWGFQKTHTIRSSNCRSKEQATFLARRKCAEDRRAHWQFKYTVSGHTTASTTGERAVWTPDTVIDVDDDLLGMHGIFYLAECTYRRNPQTETELVLMRPQDLLFGPSEF